MFRIARCFLACAFAGVVLLGLSGCGSSYEGPQRAAVSGKVTFDGEPIANGSLNLLPVDHEGRAASTPITDGAYLITEENGPNLGKYRVEILSYESTGKAAAAEGDDEDSEAQEANTRQVIPAKYNSASELELEIDEADFEKDFELTSD